MTADITADITTDITTEKRVGEVPNFALNPDGSSCDTVFFYKQIVG